MKQNSAMTIIAAVVVIGVLVYVASAFNVLPQQTNQGGGSGAGSPTVPAGYSSFPINVNVPLKDSSAQASAVTTASVSGKIYPSGTGSAVASSPLTPSLDSSALGASSTGTLNFTGKLTNTGSAYEMKLWDAGTTETWYPQYVTGAAMTISAYPATYTGAAIQPNVFMDRVGTFGNITQSNGTYADGTVLSTVNSTDSAQRMPNTTMGTTDQTLTINKTGSASTVSFKIPLTISNSVVNSKIKNVVLMPQSALTGATVPSTAFTAASVQWNSGVNYATIMSPTGGSILSYVQNSQAIPIGDVANSGTGVVNLQFSLDTSQLTSGQSFLFVLDDQSGYLAVDNVVAQRGASPQTFTVAVIS